MRLKKQEVEIESPYTRYATPKIVADYRAERLKCKQITDLCCGIGAQTKAFSRTCDKVVAVEIDEDKLRYAPREKNIEYVKGDALGKEALEKSKDSQIVFCDTERAETEEERTIETIKPNVKKIITEYGKITDKIAIELPPHVTDIPFDCEKEYISINGELNRLTIYMGGLKKCDISVVSLPTGTRLESNKKKQLERSEIKKYLYEIDKAVVKAGIEAELGLPLWRQNKKTYLTSDEKIENLFFKKTYRVLKQCHKEQANKTLKRLDAGSITLQMSVEPKRFYEEKAKYEKELQGNKKYVLIIAGNDAAICKLV